MTRPTNFEMELWKLLGKTLAGYAASPGATPAQLSLARNAGSQAGEWVGERFGAELRDIAVDFSIIMGKARYGADTRAEWAEINQRVHQIASGIWHRHR